VTTTWETRPELPDGAPPPRPRAEQAWPPWTAPAAVITALIAATILALPVFGIEAAVGEGDLEDPSSVTLTISTLLQDTAFIGVAILFARMAGPTWGAQFGLRRTRVLPAIGWILVLYAGFLLFSGLWQLVVEIEEDTQLLEDFGADRDAVSAALLALVVCIAAPIGEEFLFRGYFFTALRNWKGLWPAAVLTGVVFGGIHVMSSPVGALVPLGVLGFGLCLLYAKTGSLYPCIAVHAINNAIAFGTLMDWTWEIPLLLVGALAASLGLAMLVARRWRPPALAQASTPAPAGPAGG
jgi:uncharacterized protein